VGLRSQGTLNATGTQSRQWSSIHGLPGLPASRRDYPFTTTLEFDSFFRQSLVLHISRALDRGFSELSSIAARNRNLGARHCSSHAS